MAPDSKGDPVTRTFRIESRFDEALREEAEKIGTSVNSLANQIFRKYTDSDRYFGRGQSITLSPRTLLTILEHLNDEEIIKAARESGESVPKDRLLMRGMMLNRESVIWFISEVLGGYVDWFTCDLHDRKDHILIHLRHVYDINWSVFLRHYLDALFREILDIDDIEFNVTDSTVSFRLDK